MVEYYRLSLLKGLTHGASWEEIYLKIDGDKSKILTTNPQMLEGVFRQKLEKMTEEDVKELFDNLHRDTGCVSCH
ncbi:MAG: hypothetical protein NTU63_02490 [Candidatus Pacearchaeota archaeon]|nr:hypothetical protein [Candidatus Pacearchaeota archaeon]